GRGVVILRPHLVPVILPLMRMILPALPRCVLVVRCPCPFVLVGVGVEQELVLHLVTVDVGQRRAVGTDHLRGRAQRLRNYGSSQVRGRGYQGGGACGGGGNRGGAVGNDAVDVRGVRLLAVCSEGVVENVAAGELDRRRGHHVGGRCGRGSTNTCCLHA